MEVKNVSQGGQTSLDFNYGSVDTIQNINNHQQNTDSKNIENNSNSEVKKVSVKDIEKAVDKLNKLFEDKATHVEYEVYGKRRDITIKIIDNDTKKVIKEVPPKKIIDMVNKLCELAGVFVDDKA
ncbi:flagellar protein FlaG [Clostridium aciditolerans]|uniref:Flagellar protein FlaG n=1 Tax=Clostridium aciditolerans TaxID=339861 RepID=A0A934M4L8_9CLOT|nr:flagellar protein FlaG [Clostridium aciditolerans]MBI6872728.1 flagellar protein FlaG [Clostridium aciditolerans]